MSDEVIASAAQDKNATAPATQQTPATKPVDNAAKPAESQPAGDDHVGARRFVGPVRPYEIGQIAFRQAEQFDERRLRACRE